jgi:hypothetical protein
VAVGREPKGRSWSQMSLLVTCRVLRGQVTISFGGIVTCDQYSNTKDQPRHFPKIRKICVSRCVRVCKIPHPGLSQPPLSPPPPPPPRRLGVETSLVRRRLHATALETSLVRRRLQCREVAPETCARGELVIAGHELGSPSLFLQGMSLARPSDRPIPAYRPAHTLAQSLPSHPAPLGASLQNAQSAKNCMLRPLRRQPPPAVSQRSGAGTRRERERRRERW